MSGMQMKDGFYPALGTPTTQYGTLMKDSFSRQIELMIDAGAQGVLCMGSMGKMESVKNNEYPKVVHECVTAVANRVPVMVGVMDCSIGRIIDRIDAIENTKIEGIVATAPFYYKVDSTGIINFFKLLAKISKYPVYIYDLPSVTQSPITSNIMDALSGEQNIRGIKTANLSLIVDLQRNNRMSDDFSFFCSNLDLFDIAIRSKINKNLDGMFTCTPFNSKRMYLKERDDAMITLCLLNILRLRNLFVKENVLAAYSYAMELLDCPGEYHPDYALKITEELKEEILQLMKEINEI